MTEVYDLPLSSGVVISTLFDKPTLFNNISKTFINFMFFACLYSCKTNAKNSAGEKICKQQSVIRQREFKQRRRRRRQRGRQKCKRFRRRLQGCGQIFERTNFLTCANSLHRTIQTLSQILGLFADKKNLHDSAGPVKTKGRSVQFCPRLPKQQLCTYMTRFCTFFTVAPRLTTT